MNIIRLHADSFLSVPSYAHASIITDPEQLVVCHCHDYFEVFLVSQGFGEHVVNGTKQHLEPGMLYFMRPDDVHYYDRLTSTFQIVNIIVPQAVIRQFLDFVGDSYYSRRLLSPVLPPHAELSHKEFSNLMEMLHQMLISGKIMKQESETLFRIALFNLLTLYFPVLPEKNSLATPDWLKIVSIEMTKKQNFTEGLPALYRLAGKSVEHVSRTCRRYLNKTPSKLVNDIRLEYAAQQLIQTDREILDVCTDAGFDSLSHFYHLFRGYFGTSPKQFRESARELSLQDHVPEWQASSAEITNAIPLRSVVNIP